MLTSTSIELTVRPLKDVTFGREVIGFHDAGREFVGWCEHNPERLSEAFYAPGGLLIISGLHDFTEDPLLLVRLSRLFGDEVDNYQETLTNKNFFHPEIAEILVLSNNATVSFQPPARAQPPTRLSGGFPVQYPHRREWHTDQSSWRPAPPDVSLPHGVSCPPQGQGQTIHADATCVIEALDDEVKRRIGGLEGLHAITRTVRR